MLMSMRPVLCVLACLAFVSQSQATELQRGVLVDPANSQVLMMRPEGGIAAIDIANGKLRWTSQAADMPVALSENRVLAVAEPAERGRLHYALIDGGSGAVSGHKSAPLPHPARALINDRLGEHFQIKAGSASLDWSYRHSHVSGALLAGDDWGPTRDGAAPKKAQPEDAAVALAGSFSVDWADAKLSPVANSKGLASEKPRAVEIGLPQPGAARRFYSASGAHILLSEPTPQGSYRWTLQDSKGGALGSIDSQHSYLPFEVVQGVLLFVQPLSISFEENDMDLQRPELQAINLSDGKLLWQADVRDTEFRGPYPP
jgi:hypothetical protein